MHRSTNFRAEISIKILDIFNYQLKHSGAGRQKGISTSVEIFFMFVVIFFKEMDNKTIIRFGFCEVSVSVIILSLRLRLVTLTLTLIIPDTYLDLDYSRYHKNFIQ